MFKMFKAVTSVYVLLSLAMGQCSGLGHDGMEPRCTSVFDWDYKVLQKLSDLESEIKILKSKTALLPSQGDDCNCKDGWISFKGKCYFFVTEKKSYYKAQYVQWSNDMFKMFKAVISVYVLLSLAMGQCSGLGHDGMEPRCTSVFDWDYKVLQKLSDLESEIKILKSKAALLPSQGDDCNCKDGWISFKGKCYFFVTEKKSYYKAQAFCAIQGGKLAEPLTFCENEFIKSMARKFKTDNWWFGLSDEAAEGKWVWPSSGNSLTYADWKNTQPNQGRSANCAMLWSSHEYGWADDPCKNDFNAICEI